MNMKKRALSRLLAWVLSLCLVSGLLPPPIIQAALAQLTRRGPRNTTSMICRVSGSSTWSIHLLRAAHGKRRNARMLISAPFPCVQMTAAVFFYSAASLPCLPCRARPCLTVTRQACRTAPLLSTTSLACRSRPRITLPCQTMPARPRRTKRYIAAPDPASPRLPYQTVPGRAIPNAALPRLPNRATARLAAHTIPTKPSQPYLASPCSA